MSPAVSCARTVSGGPTEVWAVWLFFQSAGPPRADWPALHDSDEAASAGRERCHLPRGVAETSPCRGWEGVLMTADPHMCRMKTRGRSARADRAIALCSQVDVVVGGASSAGWLGVNGWLGRRGGYIARRPLPSPSSVCVTLGVNYHPPQMRVVLVLNVGRHAGRLAPSLPSLQVHRDARGDFLADVSSLLKTSGL